MRFFSSRRKAQSKPEAMWRSLFENAPDIIITVDQAGTILFINRGMSGQSPDELIGTRLHDYVLPEYHDIVSTSIRRVFRTGERDRYEVAAVGADGKTRWYESRLAPIRKGNRVLAAIIINTEITERKVLERALGEERELLTLTLESIGEGIVVTDAGHQIILANAIGRQYLAVLTEAQEGDVLTHLGSSPLRALLSPPPSGMGSHEIMPDRPPQRFFEVQVHTARPTDEPNHYVFVIRDVTRERQIQEQIEQRDRLAGIGQLAAGIAHDFNNMLTSIIGFAQLLHLGSDVSDTGKRYLRSIIDQGAEATGLIRQILDFSRESINRPEPLELGSLLAETVGFLERAIPEGVRIRYVARSADHIINADPVKMRQILTNLAVNARDAMPDGGELTLQLSSFVLKAQEPAPIIDLPAGEWVVLSVSDTGVGIPEETQSRIFEPFFTTKGEKQGTGLGLAQVYGIIKQHGGYIDVRSQVGQGTTFYIYLPALTGVKSMSRMESHEEIAYGQGETILLVEDDPKVRKTVGAMLDFLKYQVLIASSGQEALRVCDDYRDEIAIVLTGLFMPGVDGVVTIRNLRQRFPNIRIAVLTGYPLQSEVKRILSQESVEVLPKPVDLVRLAQFIDGYLKGDSRVN